MTDWKALGARLATPIATALERVFGDRVRASYAKKYGKCRRCDRPLGGESPDQICEECHADELLERAGGRNPPGDA